MYICPAKVVDFGDLIQYVDQDGVTKTGRVVGLTLPFHPGESRLGDLYISFRFDNGQKFYTKCKTQVTILEMSHPDSLARTRNNPNNWKLLGIKKVG